MCLGCGDGSKSAPSQPVPFHLPLLVSLADTNQHYFWLPMLVSLADHQPIPLHLPLLVSTSLANHHLSQLRLLLLIVVDVPTLSHHRYYKVHGHRTGRTNFGVEQFLSEKNSKKILCTKLSHS